MRGFLSSNREREELEAALLETGLRGPAPLRELALDRHFASVRELTRHLSERNDGDRAAGGTRHFGLGLDAHAKGHDRGARRRATPPGLRDDLAFELDSIARHDVLREAAP